MKRLIAAVVLIISLVALCWSGIAYVDSAYNSLHKDIERCVTEIENKNFDNAAELSKALAEKWQKIRGQLSIFINHGTVGEIDESTVELASFANKENEAHFLAECEKLRLKFAEMKEYCGVSLHTLF